MYTFIRIFVLALVLGAIAVGLTGCATDEPENLSEKPWNDPSGFGTGMLPSNINEGR